MKQIPLTQGKIAIVDDADYTWLSQWKWCVQKDGACFYARCNFEKVAGKWSKIYMHRLILGFETGDGQIGDHKNHDTLDNRRKNLRVCSRTQNAMNQTLSKNSTSGFKGVFWDKEKRKWVAQLRTNGKRKYLGGFVTPELAALAYDVAAAQEFGDFACLNFN